MHSATILILLSVGLLLTLTLMRGWLAFRLPGSEALTIEEGLEALRRRVTGVDYLRTSLAVLVTLALALSLSIASTATFADVFLVLTGLLAFIVMLIPWCRRKTLASIAHTLGTSSKKGEGESGQLSRLLRTYFYYQNNPGSRPALFDYTRRQLAVRILGIDLRAHAPLSTRMIASTTAKLSALMALLALLAWLLAGPDAGARVEGGKRTPPALESTDAQNQTAALDRQTLKEVNTVTDTAAPASGESPETVEDTGNPMSDQKGSAAAAPAAAGDSTHSLEDKDEHQNNLASDTGSAPGQSKGQEGKSALGLLGGLFQSLQALLGGEQKTEGPTATLASDGEKTSGTDGKGDGISASMAASGRTSEGQPSQKGAKPSDRPTGSGEAQDTPPSDEGEGATGQSRISRGVGPKLFGKATRRPDAPGVDAQSLQLTVDQEVQRGKPQETGSTSRPTRFNPMKPLSPDDVALSPADPFINQRVPAEYRQALKRILAKP